MALDSFRVSDQSNEASNLGFRQLAVSDISLDLVSRSLAVGSVVIDEFAAQAWRDESGSIAMPQGSLFAASEPSENTASSDTDEVVNADSTPERPWQVIVEKFDFTADSLAFVDQSLEEPTTLAINSLELSVTQIHLSDPSKDLAGTLSLVINNAGELEVDIAGNLSRQRFSGGYDLAAFDLTTFKSYVSEYTTVRIDSAQIGSVGSFGLEEGIFQFSAESMDLESLQVTKVDSEESLLSMQLLDVDGVQYSPEGLVVDKIEIVEPVVTLAQSESGFNMSSILKGKEEPAPAEQENAKEEKATPAEAEQSAEETASPYKIKQFAVTQGNVAFSDSTLPDVFQTALRDFNLVVSDIDSSPEQKMKVGFEGKVDGGAKLLIDGELLPAEYKKYSGIDFTIENYDLRATDPYWKNYLGRELSGGTLTIKSRYDIQSNKLKGKNNIRIEDLKLGGKVESPNAIGLPIEFAIGLLKDPSGVIQLNPPISGTLDEATPSVMPIIGKVFMNLILKAAASPFKFLGGLGGGKEDLDQLKLELGTVELGPSATDHLDSLATMLTSRPALNLIVSSELDVEGERNVFKKAIIAAYCDSLETASDSWPPEPIDPFEAINAFNHLTYGDTVEAAYSSIDWPLAQSEPAVSTEKRVKHSDVARKAEETSTNVREDKKPGIMKRVFGVFSRKNTELREKETAPVEPSANEIERSKVAEEVATAEPEMNAQSFESKEAALWERIGMKLGEDFYAKLSELRTQHAVEYLTADGAIAPERISTASQEEGGLADNSGASSLLRFSLQ